MIERRDHMGELHGPDLGEAVVVVSGLPRSGTSMMMRMLEAGGVPIFTDGVRTADVDNPQGYYELEAVKGLYKGRHEFLVEARGRAVKVVSPLLRYLPRDHRYRIVFMRRRMAEILASQRLMLQHRREPEQRLDDQKLTALFEDDLRKIEQWMGSQPNVQALFVSYNGLLEEPLAELSRVDRFLGGGLDLLAMTAVADQALYRQRR
jgi:hypothetical protein